MGLPSMVVAENVTNWASWVVPDSFPFNGLTSTIKYAPGTTGTVVDPVGGETVDLILSGEVWQVREDFSWYVLGFDDAGKVTFTPDYNGIPVYTSEVSPTAIFGSDQVAATGDTLDEYMAHTLTFSQDVTNAVMPIYSLGALPTEARLTFSQPFVVLSSDGRFASGGDSTSGYTLSGNEGNGLIQFLGTYDTISWVVEDVEISHGISIGLTTPPNPLAGTAVPVFDLFGEGTGVTAPTTFAVFEPEPEPDPPTEPEPEPEPDPPTEPEPVSESVPEPEPQTVLERVLAQIDAATNLAPINGIYANVAENIGGANGSGVDGSITNIITGVTGLTQQIAATADDMATTGALPTLDFGDMTTTALGAVNTGETMLGVNTNVDEAAARATHAVSSVMTQLGGAEGSGVVAINIAANMTGIDGSISNTLTMVDATIGNLSTTALGVVNAGSIISGVDATVQGIVGLGDDFHQF